MLRPPTHTDPNAIPRNGTDVPWIDLPEPRPQHDAEQRRPDSDDDVTPAEEQPQGR